MRKNSKRCVAGDLIGPVFGFVAWLAIAAPAWADLPEFPGSPSSGECGLLGGAAASVMLTVCGCAAVWSHRRWRG